MKGALITPEPLAAKVGAGILEQGGNIFDASVAAAFVQGVTNPLVCGVGGSSLILLHHGPSGESLLIDGSCIVGSKVGGNGSRSYQYGYRSITVPGMVKSAWKVYQKFGSGNLSWADLLEPARRLARDGFVVEPYLAEQWQLDQVNSKPKTQIYPTLEEKWSAAAEAQALFGRPKRVGDRFFQDDYSKTLHRLAKQGADDFYQGTLYEDIILDMEEYGGLFTREDLRHYEAVDLAPVSGSYRGFEIRTAVGGSSTGLQVLFMLKILDAFDLKSMSPDSPDYIDLLSRVMKAGYREHAPLLGDPPFSAALTLLTRLVSQGRAGYLQRRIRRARREDEDEQYRGLGVGPGPGGGGPESGRGPEGGGGSGYDAGYGSGYGAGYGAGYGSGMAAARRREAGGRGRRQRQRLYGAQDIDPEQLELDYLNAGATHLSAMDEEGSMVSWTQSLGTVGGAGVVTTGLGFLYNNITSQFHPDPYRWDSLLAGKRGGGGAPLLVLRNGRPVMAIGCAGGGRLMPTAVLQVMINIIDHGMTAEQAVSAPRFHAEDNDVLFLEPAYEAATAEALREKGYQVVQTQGGMKSRVEVVTADQDTGVFSAGSDPR
ncbi:MAG TPA: hypothetical protein GXX29_05430 [Firmicutes bacterium]|nr:hypothetical protein [Bacillota bacterium]